MLQIPSKDDIIQKFLVEARKVSTGSKADNVFINLCVYELSNSYDIMIACREM